MNVQGIDITHKRIAESDYISLTDMAKWKNEDIPAHVITHWLSTKYAIEFLGVWETMNNPNFKLMEFREFKNASGGSFTLSPKQWIERTNAIGIISSAGRYGGTYAHKDIAFEFATWLSAEFKYWMIQEFQRLKEKENIQVEWNAKRELARLYYHVHTKSIKDNLIPTLQSHQITYVYQDEADMLNVALFGMRASEWRKANPTLMGNMRDHASIHHLLVLSSMESYNAQMIKDGLSLSERIKRLNDMARYQLPILIQANSPLLVAEGEGGE